MKIGLIRGKEPVSRLVMKPETMMKVIGAAALAGAAAVACAGAALNRKTSQSSAACNAEKD